MIAFDQIARIVSTNMQHAVDMLTDNGYRQWVHDQVTAVHLFAHPTFHLGETFEVTLAFNYEMFPGMEFELIRPVSGRTVQLVDGRKSELSHFGYHVPDIPPPGIPDALQHELREWKRRNGEVVQVSQTVHHTGTTRRYRYAFVYHHAWGVPIKIIQRMHVSPINSEASVLMGKDEYAWLS